MSKVKSEKETREIYLSLARQVGAEEEFKKLMARYDEFFRGCKSNEERKAVQVMCIMEVNNFFGRHKILEIKFQDGTSMTLDDQHQIIGEKK